MRFRYTDLPRVKLPGVLYSVELYHKPTDADIKALRDALRYEQQKAPFISWFVADGDTDSSTAVKTTKNAGVCFDKKPTQHMHFRKAENAVAYLDEYLAQHAPHKEFRFWNRTGLED